VLVCRHMGNGLVDMRVQTAWLYITADSSNMGHGLVLLFPPPPPPLASPGWSVGLWEVLAAFLPWWNILDLFSPISTYY